MMNKKKPRLPSFPISCRWRTSVGQEALSRVLDRIKLGDVPIKALFKALATNEAGEAISALQIVVGGTTKQEEIVWFDNHYLMVFQSQRLSLERQSATILWPYYYKGAFLDVALYTLLEDQ